MIKLSKFCRLGLAQLIGMLIICCLPWVAIAAGDLDDAKNAYGAGKFEEAANLLRPLVRQENKDALYLLARMYEQGDGVPKDVEEARRLYTLAAKKGHELAQTRIDMFDAQSNSKSVVIEWYLPAAQEGDTEAQYNLAFMYETGWGVTENLDEAARWYKEAADLNHDLAQLRLGLMTIVGVGTARSMERGVTLLRSSAENGNRIAEMLIQDLFDVGEVSPEDAKQIVAGLRRVIDEGEQQALATLRRSITELHNQPKSKVVEAQPSVKSETSVNKSDIVKAVTKRDSILVKDSEPPAALKHDEESGEHKKVAKENLFNWYSSAANTGDADAQFHLGALYIQGDQVAKDVEEGVHWIKLAAEQGHEMALSYMSLWESSFEGNDLTSTIALNWLKQAGREWDMQAIFNLGYLYESGRGVELNFRKATQWYKFAAVEGNAEAKRRLDLLRKGNSNRATDGISFSQAEGIGAEEHSPVLESVLLILLISGGAGYFYWRRSQKAIKPPQFSEHEREVFQQVSGNQGMQSDDRKFFEELWDSKGPAEHDKPPVIEPKPVARAREQEERIKVESNEDASAITPQMSTEKSTALSEVEAKLAAAVNELIIETAGEGKSPEKGNAPIVAKVEVQVKAAPQSEKIETPRKDAEPTGRSQTIEKAMERKLQETAVQSNYQPDSRKLSSDDLIQLDVDSSFVTADAFMSNGISKDELASSRISADSLFADGVAIDEAGRAVGRAGFNPHKLNADSVLSMDDLSISRSSRESQPLKKRPVGRAAGLLPSQSIAREKTRDELMPEISRPLETPTVSSPAGLSDDEERSLAEVHFNIGVMFSNGDGVPKNDTQAAKWFLKAAEEGLPEAQFSLGQAYLTGTGVAKDPTLGLEWIQKAAANHFKPALDALRERNKAI